MSVNGKTIVEQQYKTADNLNTRISIHQKYSTNTLGFGNWIVSNYEIHTNDKMLELGCGTGDMWEKHLHLLQDGCHLHLTDFSSGMVDYAKTTLGEPENISFEVVDIENIPYEDGSFDTVIANMMLYHVPDIHRGLSEVTRVLKKGGKFYCATYGEHGIVEYIAGLLKEYGVEDKTNKSFTLQNGEDILQKHFSKVQRLNYEDSLAVTDIEDLLDYIYSLTSMTNVVEVKRDVLKEILMKQMEEGILHVPKEYGMFVCEK